MRYLGKIAVSYICVCYKFFCAILTPLVAERMSKNAVPYSQQSAGVSCTTRPLPKDSEEVRLEVLFQVCFNSFEYVPKPDFKEYE